MEHGITIGLDLGDKYSFFCVLDAAGHVTEEGRVKSALEDIRRKFSTMPSALVAMEVGSSSPWVSRELKRLGHRVIVAQASQIALIYQNRRKSDQVDAHTLARLARLDPKLLHPVEHRSRKAQEHLQVVRSRDLLVGTRTKLINHVRGVVKAHGLRLPGCSAQYFHRRAPEHLPDTLLVSLRPVLDILERLSDEIKGLDKEIELLCEQYQETQLLREVPGVGPVTALSFVLSLEDPRRFARSRDVGPFLGLVPRRDQSGQVDKHMRISKAGDVYLRRLLVGCAQYILGPFGPDSALRRWGLAHMQLGGKAGKRRAVVAVARKLAVLLHHLWITGEVYEPFPQTAAAGKSAGHV
jgi:transposase